MKKLLLIFAVVLLSYNAAYSQEKIDNSAVIEMVGAGLDAEVIISLMQNSPVDFSVTPADLATLKEKGVPTSIVAEMIKAKSKQASIDAQKTGIFFINGNGEEKRILPSVFSGSKTNTVAMSLTGFANANTKSIINGSESENKVPVSHQEFYFYFAPSQGSLGDIGGASDWWFKQATSPTEFALVELDTGKKNERTLKTGKVNAIAGASLGVNSKDVIDVKVEPVSETLFKVIPAKPLAQGEYCFFYQGTVPQGGYNNQSIFDFSVR